jgi:hypothetical protein
MKNTIAILLCLLLFSPKLSAQEEEMQISKNAIELDLFNFDRLYNLNYSRAFAKKNWAIIPKVGIYIAPNRGGGHVTRSPASGFFAYTAAKSNTAVNAGVDFLYGKKKHFLSLGINSMILREFFYRIILSLIQIRS